LASGVAKTPEASASTDFVAFFEAGGCFLADFDDYPGGIAADDPGPGENEEASLHVAVAALLVSTSILGDWTNAYTGLIAVYRDLTRI